MSPLLQKIVTQTIARVREREARVPYRELERMASDAPPVRSLAVALSSSFSVIAEHKRRSPSAGTMNPGNVARCLGVYSRTQWISAISVLTELDNFSGELDDLVAARAACPSKPVLRKDFITTEYQILEARAYGADAVLLMAAIHPDPSRLLSLFEFARDLRMDALLEIGMGGMSPQAMRGMIPEEASIWGINARTFDGSRLGLRMALSRTLAAVTSRDFRTETGRHGELRSLIPPGKIAVAESGIVTADELGSARDTGYDAALIGTAFLKGGTIEDAINRFSPVFLRQAAGSPSSIPSSALS